MKLKNSNVYLRALMPALFASMAFSFSVATAAEIIKLQNNTALDQSGAWSGGVLPTAADVMLWDATYGTPAAATTLSQLGASTTVAGLKVTNVGGTLNAATTMVGYQNTSSASTLTIGSLGIDLSNATQGLYLSSAIKLDADQTWSIKNANTAANPMGLNNNEDLGMIAQTANVPINLNGKTLTLSGLGQSTISSGYTLSNGTINVNNNLLVIQGGSNRLTTVNADVSFAVSATNQLRLQSNSGPLTSSAPIALNGTLNLLNNNTTNAVTQNGNLTLNNGCTLAFGHAQNGVVNVTGTVATSGTIAMTVTGTNAITTSTATTVPVSANISGAISGSGNINLANTTNAANAKANNLRLSGDNSGYSGTFTIGGSANRGIRLTTANSGSTAATWAVNAANVLEVDGVTVSLGKLNGAGTVTNSHATNAATVQIASGLFSGVIANGTAATNVEKIGSGLLTLSGANTYTGTTVVSQGMLAMGSLSTGASNVTVADGATFRVDPATQDGQLALGAVVLGSSSGSTLLVNNGTFTNPTIAPMLATDLTVNAPTTLEYSAANIATGTFPLVAYTNINGTLGFSGLTLKLPPRVVGSLVNNTANGTLDVVISSVEGIRWIGSVDNNWDVDSTGAGATGTANWETTVTTAATRFLQAPSGVDAALFDDQADGSGDVTVNLTTTHTPTSLMVNNPTRNYIFLGNGSLSGVTGLEKVGAGSLQISNTSVNNYTGVTFLDEGSIILGDGVTAGAGVITSSVDSVAGTSLVLNRPDNHDFTNLLIGEGKLVKNQANVVTLPSAFSANYDIEINAGTLKFTGGGTLSRLISGAGALEINGGTATIGGSVPNTITGTTTIHNANVTFSNTAGPAIAGDLVISGTSRISPTVGTQLAPTASISVIGSNADSYLSGAGLSAEVVTNVLVNSSVLGVGGAQLILRNGMQVTGLATLNSGVLGVGSGNTATLKAINITAVDNTSAIMRVAGSGGPSTMNIGDGGLAASGGEWQIKFNTNNQDSIVNLGGDITTTGNFIISNAGYTGANRNVINLTGTRTLTIGRGTTTTCAADFADDATLTADLEDAFTGNLIKAGAGKLVLGPLCNVGHSGTTMVNEGSLIVNGTMPIQAPTLAAGAVLGGNGTITAATTIPSGATISPGNGTAATLNFVSDVTLASGSTYAVDITGASAVDRISTPAATLSAGGTIAVTLTGFAPAVDQVFDLADANSITGTPTFDFTAAPLASGLGWDTTAFATNGTIKVVSVASGFEVFAQSITNPDDRDLLDDADGDGISNLMEYVLGGVPTVAAQNILPNSTVSATELVFSFKRNDASEADTTQVVEVSSDLINWSTVIPVTATSGGNVTVLENGVADDDVTVTIAKGTNTELFARLKVTRP